MIHSFIPSIPGKMWKPSDSDSEDFIIENVEDVPVLANENFGAQFPTTGSTGAIKKKPHYSQKLLMDFKAGNLQSSQQIDFSQFSNFQNKEYLPSNFQSIVDLINSGLRVCVIMRGVPGSGKSWLANKIVDCTVRKSHRNYIFSTDDFFMDPDGNYVSFLGLFCGSLF
jgi:hypothetical protein